MNELKLFENPDFGNVRTLETDDGRVMFCGKDVAAALGYVNTAKAVREHCKGVTEMDTPTSGGIQAMKFIPESDVYRLAFGSKLPNAERFTDWVAEEVIPSIRRHGAYMTDDVLKKALTSPDFLIRLATELKSEKEKNQRLENKIEADKPKVIFADAVSVSQRSILVGELAKLLRQNGVKIGQNRLFEWMRENGYLMNNGRSYNMPTQYSMERGLFEVKETPIIHSDGYTTVNFTPKVTGKGQLYFINLFLSSGKEDDDDD